MKEGKGKKEKETSEIRKPNLKIITAWTGHPHLRIIDKSTNFEGKMQRLINEIS